MEVPAVCAQMSQSVMLLLEAAAILIMLFDDGPRGESEDGIAFQQLFVGAERGWSSSSVWRSVLWTFAEDVDADNRMRGRGGGSQRMRSMGAETGCVAMSIAMKLRATSWD